jgi:erythronate-4-phosphate dehydrogenase
LNLGNQQGFELRDKSIAVIGAGNTGSATAEKLTALGVEVLYCDPPLNRAGDPRQFVSLEQAIKADIVSLHVPLTHIGSDATWHLIDRAVLSEFRPDQILINACRGAVVDNQALLTIKSGGRGPHLVLDVWESEPAFDPSLLPHVSLATPHIAGYSLEGKARGTLMLYQAVCELLGLAVEIDLQQLLSLAGLGECRVEAKQADELWKQLVPRVYDIKRDDRRFRQHAVQPGGFDRLRKNYWPRREFSSLKVSNANPREAAQLAALGFSCR